MRKKKVFFPFFTSNIPFTFTFPYKSIIRQHVSLKSRNHTFPAYIQPVPVSTENEIKNTSPPHKAEIFLYSYSSATNKNAMPIFAPKQEIT